LRILNFSKLDGIQFASVIAEAVETTLGARRILPLKIVEGDLVSKLWKESPYGEAYLQKLVGTDVRGVTAVASRQTAGGTERVSTPRQEHLAAAEGRPAVSRDFSRVVDIYATEVRPLEERFYEWLRGLRDLACRGEWEKIPKELQAFIRKLLRKLPRTAEQESAPAETPPRKGKARTRRAEAAVHPRLLSGASRLPKRFPRLCRSGTSGGYGST
jgi:hypothetical protein